MSKDHKWSLIYVGGSKEYRVTEYRRINGEWVKVNDSVWNTLESALGHIGASNDRRKKGEVG